MDFMRLSADLESHPITGYLPNGDYVHMPLISNIVDNLYVGGCKDGVNLMDYFDYIFSMYKWESYRADPSTKVRTVLMYDSNHVDADEVMEIAQMVSDALDTGGKVLVHCQAGINRSNLIAGAALIMRGMHPQNAVDLLRLRRGQAVLANKTFEKFLLSGVVANPR